MMTPEEFENGLAVEWICPECGTENVDYYHLTTFPVCENCEIDVDWSDLLTNDRMEELNQFWIDNEPVP